MIIRYVLAALLLCQCMASGSADELPTGWMPRTPSPEVVKEIANHKAEILDFLITNATALRTADFLLEDPVFAMSPLKGVTAEQIATMKSNLRYNGVGDPPPGAKPNFYFITYDQSDDLRQLMQQLGLPKTTATLEWLIVQQLGNPDCLSKHITMGGPNDVIVFARADGSKVRPGQCFANFAEQYLGISQGLSSFIKGASDGLVGAIQPAFVRQATACRRIDNNKSAIADCMFRSFGPLEKK
jgi:hypothetical protein